MTTPERPLDPPLSAAWLREGSFTYTDEGEGPVLVALHGLPGGVRDYRWLAPALAGVRLIRLEQPGFGGTPTATAPDPTLAGRARFVLSALDALGIDRFAVLGHSMGGPLATAVAASATGRARGLALLASVGQRPHRLIRKLGRYPDLPRILDLPLVGSLLVKGPLKRGFVRAGFPETTPDESVRQCMRIVSGLSFPEIRAAFAGVRCPTFLAWAEDDPLVEGAIGLELASTLPDGPRLVFDQGGHNVQKSQAFEIGQALSRWLRELAVG